MFFRKNVIVMSECMMSRRGGAGKYLVCSGGGFWGYNTGLPFVEIMVAACSL